LAENWWHPILEGKKLVASSFISLCKVRQIGGILFFLILFR